jgi:dienelactone hydrolase
MNVSKGIVGAICLLSLLACRKTPGPSEIVTANGLRRQEVWVTDENRIWIYLPKGSAENRPLVVIAAAGSPMFRGMALAEGDMPEHEPYALAGCVVVAYDVSGPEPSTRWGAGAAVRKFLASNGGVEDGRRAIDYALKNVPGIDSKRIIAAGHSSAATIALQLALSDSRVSACVAYAPCVDTERVLKDKLSDLERDAPGFRDFIARSSLLQHAAEWGKPCFLFVARDDSVIDPAEVREFAQRSPGTQLFEAQSGDHYDSMIYEGIPMALEWLRKEKLLTQ